jgi:hypothetical protein
MIKNEGKYLPEWIGNNFFHLLSHSIQRRSTNNFCFPKRTTFLRFSGMDDIMI